MPLPALRQAATFWISEWTNKLWTAAARRGTRPFARLTRAASRSCHSTGAQTVNDEVGAASADGAFEEARASGTASAELAATR